MAGSVSAGAALCALTCAALLCVVTGGSCSHLANCNSHGICDTATSSCVCFNGWGSPTDVAIYKAPDCSMRTCPSDAAWVDVPTSSTTAHAPAECSNMGLCDRTTGKCRCFAGYDGEACQRSACPGRQPCSGNGKCMSLMAMAPEPNAVPFGPAAVYGGAPQSTTWDESKIFGCVCDSTWTVGFGVGETQQTQWFGADCAQRHCPSGDDPRTPADETNCAYYANNGATWMGIVGSDGLKYPPGATLPAGVTVATPATGTPGVDQGVPGNLCFVECANRGTCDYATGTCACQAGYAGANCALKLTQPPANRVA